MYLNMTIEMPKETGKLTTKKIKGTPYIYYEIGRTYDAKKKYNSPKRVCVGKQCANGSGRMIPNTNFLRYFPESINLDDEIITLAVHEMDVSFAEIPAVKDKADMFITVALRLFQHELQLGNIDDAPRVSFIKKRFLIIPVECYRIIEYRLVRAIF